MHYLQTIKHSETCRNNDRVNNCGTSANCLGRTCNQRNVECVVNNCRTCTAKFYDENRRELSAQECGRFIYVTVRFYKLVLIAFVLMIIIKMANSKCG